MEELTYFVLFNPYLLFILSLSSVFAVVCFTPYFDDNEHHTNGNVVVTDDEKLRKCANNFNSSVATQKVTKSSPSQAYTNVCTAVTGDTGYQACQIAQKACA